MKRILWVALVVLSAATLSAQEEQREAPVKYPPGQFPCPHPYSQTFKAPPPATPAPVLSELPANMQSPVAGSQWNQTAINKHFAHTFRFPSERQCCLISKATLSVTIKALQGGPKDSPSSANDMVYVFAGGTVLQSQQPWKNGVATGTTTTLTFNFTQQQLAGGMLTIYVQDDTAVVSASLNVSGCCIRKP